MRRLQVLLRRRPNRAFAGDVCRLYGFFGSGCNLCTHCVWPRRTLGRTLGVVVSSRGGRKRGALSQYTVDDLAQRTDLTPRTIRSYQTQGLLPSPERHGRVAYYDDSHVERLEEIAELKADGVSLAGIQDVLTRRAAGTRAKASRAKARAKPEKHSRSPAQETAGWRGAAETAPATRTGAFTPETHFVGTTRVPLLGISPETKAETKAGDNADDGKDSESPGRRLGLVASVILGLLLVVAAVSSVIAVLSLSDAADDRRRLGRQVSDLQSDLSRLDGNEGPPSTVVVPGPVQQVPAPETPSSAPPPTRTVIVTTPRQAPAAPSTGPPATTATSTTQPCTLNLPGISCVLP